MWRDRGLHNQSKCKVLLYLYWNKNARQQADETVIVYDFGNQIQEGMTVFDLYEKTGVSLGTLQKSLPRWFRWGLVSRFPVAMSGRGGDGSGRQWRANRDERPAWAYQITGKGESWIRNYASDTLNVERFKREMQAWQVKRRAELQASELEMAKRMVAASDLLES